MKRLLIGLLFILLGIGTIWSGVSTAMYAHNLNVARGALREVHELRQEIEELQEQYDEKHEDWLRLNSELWEERQRMTSRGSYRRDIAHNLTESQEYARVLTLERGWTDEHFQDLVRLWNRESNWNPNAVNPSSGASGIPQAMPSVHQLPQNFMSCWETQIEWGLSYIERRYYNPTRAWQHFLERGWY